MGSMYEDIMRACLNNNTKSSLTESGKHSKKKAVLESRLFEDEELDNVEVTDTEDIDFDENNLFTGTEGEAPSDEKIEIDPEEELSDEDETDVVVTAVPAEDIPDDELKDMDAEDFAGDFIYHCKCCGQVVLSKEALADGDPCPNCGEINYDEDSNESCLEVVGKVAEIEDTAEDEEVEDTDEVEDTEDTEEVEDTETEEEVDDSDIVNTEAETEETPAETEEETAKESYKRTGKYSNKRYSKESKRTMNTKRELMLDESTFNPFLKKFVSENYENAQSFRVVGAKKSGKHLTLECRLTFKSGKSKIVKLESNNFAPTVGKFNFTATEDNAFKIENTRRDPFIFEATLHQGIIRCEGLKYNYNTVIGEKKYKVYGSLIKESRAMQTSRNSHTSRTPRR